jgi:ArsR family transcriptional regulator
MSGRTPDIDLDEPQSPPGADCCTSGHSLTDTEISGDVQLLSTLGSSTRYEPLRIIAGSDRGACGCELEPLLDISQGAVSQALSRLHKAGLVDRRKNGRWRHYTATPRATEFLRVLDETRDDQDG